MKTVIAEKTDSTDVQKWTVSLLTKLAFKERENETFRNCEVLQRYAFTNRYWDKYMDRHGLNFSSRKSDQRNFTPEEIEQFKGEISRKIMFYKNDQLLNFDESGVFWNQTRGRTIVAKGMSY